jgi:integrase
MKGFKLRIRMPDGRQKLAGCGTQDRTRYDGMRAWIQTLKKGRARRLDILEAIMGGVSLADAYDLRKTPDAILNLSGVRNIEPYVAKWHAEKAKSRKGADSAAKYLRQVREFVPENRNFAASRMTGAEVKKWLRGLDVEDPTRNRYKAALSSFCEYLVDEGVLTRNPVRDVRGFSEGAGRWGYYELDEARRLLERVDDPDVAGAVALALGACFEWQAIQRVKVRDIDLERGLAFADGGKTQWRRRQCRILTHDARGERPLFDFTVPYIAAVLRNKLPDALVFEALRSDKQVLAGILRASKAAGIKYLTLHDQRHTHAVSALRAGYSVMVVAHQEGHSNTNLVWTRYGRFVVDDRDYKKDHRQDSRTGT